MKTRFMQGACLALLIAITAPAHSLEAPKPDKPRQGTDAKPSSTAVREVNWDALLPEHERDTLSLEPPPPAHDYLDESGAPATQSPSSGVNPELDGVRIRLPGFIVPLELGREGTVREFFLVPYFGACIHVPPPPANQIVYVRSATGIALDSIYDAYWVTGKMRIQDKTTRLAAASYSLTAEKVEVYEY